MLLRSSLKTMEDARNNFAECLFDLKDNMDDLTYVKIQDSAMRLVSSKDTDFNWKGKERLLKEFDVLKKDMSTCEQQMSVLETSLRRIYGVYTNNLVATSTLRIEMHHMERHLQDQRDELSNQRHLVSVRDEEIYRLRKCIGLLKSELRNATLSVGRVRKGPFEEPKKREPSKKRKCQ